MYRKTAYMSILLAFALILSYIESLIPFFFTVPGMKLGLANFAVVLTLYLWGYREAFTVNILRIVLSGFMFGNLYMILYGLAGGMLSFSVMCVLKRTGAFNMASVSMAGGISHNIGQFLVAMLVVRTGGLLFYLPALLASGLVTGFVIGVITKQIFIRVYQIGGGIDDRIFKG